jgi:hypothetical protein
MAGRPSKPVQLIKLEGNKDRRTKAELEFREKAERALYTGTTFKESPAVKADPVAHKEFLRLKKLYKNIQFVDGLDEQMINRYCLLISQEQKLMESDDFLALHKTREMILKLEDRLFLNPVSRIKAIPKKPPEEEKESPMAQFLKRRAGG